MRLIILLMLTSCSNIEYWKCYKNGERAYAFPLEPIDQSKYDFCKSWKVNG